MYFKENKGVTLLALTITIIVMLIITSTIIYNTNNYVRTEKINKLYNDIENISNKIEDYYLKYGEIPTIGNVYCNRTGLNDLLSNNANAQNATLKKINNVIINPNDGDEYYIIDLEKLEGLTLNYGYGDDYTTVKELKDTPEDITTDFDEIYIINKATHQIYYPSGVFADNFMYYSYSLNTNEAIEEYNVSSTDGKISFNNENVVNINNLKIYGDSIQNGDPELDNPVEIESIGDLVTDTSDENYGKYKVPVTVSGKNLFNIDGKIGEYYPNLIMSKAGNINNGDGSITIGANTTGTAGCGYKITNTAGKTYTFSCDVLSNGTGSGVCMNICIPSRINYKLLYTVVAGKKGILTVSFTEDIDEAIFCFITRNGINAIVSNIQIEFGSSTTEFEPYVEPITTNIYLDEPLRKVGDNADYIDLLNKKVVRNVDVLDDTGTLTIEESYQGLSTPTEETIEFPTISTNKGSNIISVDTKIPPSNIELNYYKINK